MVFLMYCLMTAYAAGSGSLIADFVEEGLGISITNSLGSLIFIVALGICLYIGAAASDYFNRLLMVGLILTYIFLVILGFPHIHPDYLNHKNWSAVLFVAPILVISFGFHNLIPSLTRYLERDVKKLRLSIILGATIPLVVYLLWEALILGLIPEEAFKVALDKGSMATHALKAAAGSPMVLSLAQAFAFFAITTSFIGNALSIMDFLSDNLRLKKSPGTKLQLCLATVLPPFIFAMFYPHLFLEALNIAGAYGAVVLFGILPALMAWRGRKFHQKAVYRVFGGKVLLGVLIGVSVVIIVLQLVNDFVH
jgi:tyrosine-specific transport protein